MRPLRYSIKVTLDGCCDHRGVRHNSGRPVGFTMRDSGDRKILIRARSGGIGSRVAKSEIMRPVMARDSWAMPLRLPTAAIVVVLTRASLFAESPMAAEQPRITDWLLLWATLGL